MDWTQIIIAALAGGSALTVLISKLFGKKEDKAKAQSVEIGNGMSAMEFYKAIEEAVERRLEPAVAAAIKPYETQVEALTRENRELREKYEDLKHEMAEMKQEYERRLERLVDNSCYQEVCENRLKGQPV